ncbi:DNA ligase [Candidatus Woesearchaeota archaeon]|nr:MAG: DNA ligase [Candidatus Woesearchaeota archaeon]
MLFSKFVETLEKLSSTSKRLEKTNIIAGLFKKVPSELIGKVALLLTGRVFPSWDEHELGISDKLVIRAISLATGISQDEIEKLWKQFGDLGKVAEQCIGLKKQSTLFSQPLTVSKVFENLRKTALVEGEGAVDMKIKLIAELLTNATPREAKYVVRTVLGDLRIGIGEGILRDAIVWACFDEKIGFSYDAAKNELIFQSDDGREKYNEYVELVQRAYDLTNDFSVIAEKAFAGEDALKKTSVEVGKPLKVMLFQKAKDIEDGFSIVGKPCACEYKYDGFRLQIHKKADKVWLYTRRLENVTKQFPDVVSVIKEHVKADNFILDAEVIGFDQKTGKWLPFQQISHRIKRKYGIAEMVKEIPVIVNVFDAVMIDGKVLIDLPFSERRKLIERIVDEKKDKIGVAKQIVTNSNDEVKRFYEEALSLGNEGIMMKNLNAPYKPGSRVGYGVKLKPVMETLDLVIVGAEWGEGKRANWLSSFILACRDADGNLLTIGKMGTGIKEKSEEGVSFEHLTNLLKPHIIEEKGREVKIKPAVVVEVSYEEIQKSPTYSSGFALRFPRFVRIREDKSVEEISTIDDVKKLFAEQR